MDLRKISQSMLLCSGQGVKIAVLDSGLHPGMPFLGPDFRGSVYDCSVSETGLAIKELKRHEISDRNGHGSCVQSCIHTVAPDATVDHFRILDGRNNCSGTLLCYVLDYVIEQKYHLVNLSLGTRSEEHIPWLVSIMKRAYEKNVTLIAASSNVGNLPYPGRFTYTIGCEAVAGGNPLLLLNRKRSVIEFSAFGIRVPVVGPDGKTHHVTGSSFAAAHVTGLAARLVEAVGPAPSHDMKVFLRTYASELFSGSASA